MNVLLVRAFDQVDQFSKVKFNIYLHLIILISPNWCKLFFWDIKPNSLDLAICPYSALHFETGGQILILYYLLR